MHVGVVIVAAGRGDRMGTPVPKQLLTIDGRSLLQHSVAAFDAHPEVAEIVVVLPADRVGDGAVLAGPTGKACAFVAGGARRQDSVRAGAGALSSAVDAVLIHDAARPFADRALIDRVLDGVRQTGAAVPAVRSRDTVKRLDPATHLITSTLPRDEIWLAQTPQGFTPTVLAAAFAHADTGVEATDEAMLAELAGHPVRIVQGDERNVKMTTPEDLRQARAATPPRVGTGYDLHRLVDDRPLVLGGVVVDPARGPHGHSDGDVACHALVDAMLGAIGAGDIGRHFSNTDPRWKDAPGLDLLGRAAAIVREQGYAVSSCDVTVILERPKLAPHVDAIRAGIAAVLGVGVDRVSLKGKTNEGVDAVGRGEAIAAHAVAVLVTISGEAGR